MIYINNKEKLDRIKLNKDNFYVVTDFDKTITEGVSVSTWGVMASAENMDDTYSKRRTELYNYYRPIEINNTISEEEKSLEMTNWWNSHINLFYEYGLKESILKDAVIKCNLKYRDGAKEFLRKMNEYNIPVIIISAGIGNVIEEFFKTQNDCYPNIKIISNFIEFENDTIKCLKGKIIHALNKNIVNLDEESKKIIADKENILLMGDAIADLKMISEGDMEKTITVGFLEEKIEENLEFFNKEFDIVITNNSSIEEMEKVLNINF